MLDDLDEGRHRPGTDPDWSETWHLDYWSDDGSVGGYVRLALQPNRGTSWYWACLVREGDPLVAVIDDEAPLPSSALELRASGLWTDLIVQEPGDHMTVGLEAFGVAMDDPAEMYGKGWGDREALGLDLEWETLAEPFAARDREGYEISCRVHGDVLVGADRIALDGWGHRSHWWGVADWSSHEWSVTSGCLDGDTPFHAHVLPGLGRSGGYVGIAASPIGAAAVATELDEHALPVGARLRLDDLYLAADPVGCAPVVVRDRTGPVSRLPRTLVRFHAADGRLGAGWLELNQPLR